MSFSPKPKSAISFVISNIFLQNQTSENTFEWRDECTSLSGSEVTLTWRFLSNDDGVNGNAGSAGFAIDNISFGSFSTMPRLD